MAQLQKFKEIFDQCDADRDGKLKQEEFVLFVRKALNKPCPPTMYTALCQHFQLSPDNGLEWSHTKDVLLQSNNSNNNNNNVTTATNNNNIITNGNNRLLNSQRSLHRFASPQPPTNNDINNDTQDDVRSVGPIMNPNTLAESGNTTENARYFRRNKDEQIPESNNNYSNSVNNSLKESESISTSLTEKALKNHEYQNSISDGSQLEDMPEFDTDSGRKPLTATRSRTRIDTLSERRPSLLSDSGENSDIQILSLMENKLTTTKRELEKERQKRKQTESLMQQLLQQNDQYKLQISDLQNQLKGVRQDHEKENERNTQQMEGLRNKLSKLQSQVDMERAKMTHVETQNASLTSERDEAYKLLRKIEKEHESKLQKLKSKRDEELEMSNGFLQSLGVGGEKDIKVVIRQLKEKNESLQRQVDLLAETLARKEHSLFEALRAVDDISTRTDEEKIDSPQEVQKPVITPGRTNIESPNNRRIVNNHQPVTNISNNNNIISNSSITPTYMGGYHPNSRNNPNTISNTNPTTYHNSTSPKSYTTDLNANFFKNAATPDRRLQTQTNTVQPASQVKPHTGKEKQMEFMPKSLANDVAKKQDAIVNLEMANTVLGKQVADLQRQLQDLRQVRVDSRSASPAPEPKRKSDNYVNSAESHPTQNISGELSHTNLLTGVSIELP